ERLIPRYLEIIREDILAIDKALLEEDFLALSIKGHNMRGTGAAYGFEEISKLGGEIEASAVERDAVKIKATKDALALHLDSLELEFV
ncbi:MAG: Hpt domain-containing protein, partial [Deltaproteobacteria bacterium]|nr:Hpt domain-containing protein [Deltaproteobacteria bacterium]